MSFKSLKSLLVAVFSLFSVLFFNTSIAQERRLNKEPKPTAPKKSTFDANEVIFGHVLDAHEFHFLSYKGSDGKQHHATIPLPVILYSPQKGFDVFMSSKFEHGEQNYKGYELLTDEKIAEQKPDPKKYTAGQIVAVNDKGEIDNSIKVYDISLTRNVVQMLLALTLLVWVMVYMAKKYRSGQGVTTAPKGVQNLIEPIITFVRDEVAKPNLGHKYKKYFPYLLTVFFFILINNLVGLIPGSANVTGNIAFTMVLAVISFIVIMFSTKKHYWAHIFNPPGSIGSKNNFSSGRDIGHFYKTICINDPAFCKYDSRSYYHHLFNFTDIYFWFIKCRYRMGIFSTFNCVCSIHLFY